MNGMFGRNPLIAFLSLPSTRTVSFSSPTSTCVIKTSARSFYSTLQALKKTKNNPLFGSSSSSSSNSMMDNIEIFPSQKEAQLHVAQMAKDDDNANDFAKCGNLACQHDSFLNTLTSSKIVSYAPFNFDDDKKSKKGQGKGKGKGKNKGKLIVDESTEGMDGSKSMSPIAYAITLSDSIFFPAGGGQYGDHGSLSLNFKSGEESREETEEAGVELSVHDTINQDEICVLLCRAPMESSSDQVTSILKSANMEVTQKIDTDRRFDQMTQHSAQHLCSAVALADFDIGTHTFSLGEKISYIDFTVEESLDKNDAMEVFGQIEGKVNMLIRENISMTPKWLEKDDPLFETQVRSRLLPEGLEGPIRLVEIENGIDFNTCCGTHVPSLGHLQMIKFFRMENVKPTIFRVYFAAAKRLISIMDSMYDTQANLMSNLSCTETDQVQRVTQLLEEKRNREKEIRMLKDDLSMRQTKEIIEECRSTDNKFVVHDLGDVDMGYMTLISTKVLEGIEDENAVFLFVCGEEGSDEGSFLLVGDKSLVDQVGKKVAEMVKGRGGGKRGKFQGKGTCVRSSLSDVKNFLTFLIPRT